MKTSTQKQKQALAEKMREMKKAKEETAKYSRSQKELANSMKKVREEQEKIKKYEGLKRSVSDNAGGTFARSAGEAATIGVAVKFAIDDETAFADVRKTTGLAGEEAERFKKELKAATKDIPKFNSEIYEIAAAAGQAGIKLEEIPKFAADTAKVSVAFDMDARTSGGTLATWREAFKMSQKEVMVLADQMNLIGDSIKVEPAQVAEMTTAVGSLGRMANFSEAQTAALGGTLVALGVKDSSTASTAIRKLYGTLASGEAATKSVSSAFSKMGLDATQVAQDLQKDSEGTLLKVFEGLNKLDKAEQLSVTKELFGEEAMSSMGLLISNTSFLKENLKLVGDASKYSGSVMNEYNNKLDTTGTSLKLVGKSLVNSAGTLTRVFLPPIRSGADALRTFSDGLAKLSEENPKMTKALAYGVAGFVGLKLGASGAVLGIKQLSKTKEDLMFLKNTAMLVKDWKQWGPLLGGLKTGVTALGSAGKAMLFNPWVLGIGAVVAGGYLIYKNWDLIKSGFKTTYEYVTGGLKKLWELWKKFTIPGKIFSFGMDKYKEWKEKRGKAKEESATSIPAYAKGGVVSTPHLALVGDGRTPESIIPHDRSRRSQGLWFDAGKKMGMFAGEGIPALTSKVQSNVSKVNSEVRNEISITFAPVIHGGSNILEQLKKELPQLSKLIEDQVEKALQKTQKNERRMSFG